METITTRRFRRNRTDEPYAPKGSGNQAGNDIQEVMDLLSLVTHRMDALENTLEDHLSSCQDTKTAKRQETMTMILAALSTIASTLTGIIKILKS